MRAARHLPAVAAAALAIGLVVLVAGGLAERGRSNDQERRRGVSRLASVESRRYDYWRAGLDAYSAHPLRGIGAGGFRVEWLRERPVREGALEVHSLPLEMLVELGLPGVLGFSLMVGGVAVAGRVRFGATRCSPPVRWLWPRCGSCTRASTGTGSFRP